MSLFYSDSMPKWIVDISHITAARVSQHLLEVFGKDVGSPYLVFYDDLSPDQHSR